MTPEQAGAALDDIQQRFMLTLSDIAREAGMCESTVRRARTRGLARSSAAALRRFLETPPVYPPPPRPHVPASRAHFFGGSRR